MVKDLFLIVTVFLVVVTRGNINIRDYVAMAGVFFLLDRTFRLFLTLCDEDANAFVVRLRDVLGEVRHKVAHSNVLQEEIVKPIASIWRDVPEDVQKQFMDVSDVMAADEFLNLLREKQEP